MKKKKKGKNEKQRSTGPVLGEATQVILGVRMSEAERQKIKVYAAQHNTTVTFLIRSYINSLSGD